MTPWLVSDTPKRWESIDTDNYNFITIFNGSALRFDKTTDFNKISMEKFGEFLFENYLKFNQNQSKEELKKKQQELEQQTKERILRERTERGNEEKKRRTQKKKKINI